MYFEAELRRLKQLLQQQRMEQLRIQEANDKNPLFTYQFPERLPSEQDDFAVPPSDPRYYSKGM